MALVGVPLCDVFMVDKSRNQSKSAFVPAWEAKRQAIASYKSCQALHVCAYRTRGRQCEARTFANHARGPPNTDPHSYPGTQWVAMHFTSPEIYRFMYLF